LNINFQPGVGTTIDFTDQELVHARIMLQAMCESGILSKESKEVVLRISLRMQAVIFRKMEEQRAKERYRLCTKCCTEVDTDKDAFIIIDGTIFHQVCPKLKGDRP